MTIVCFWAGGCARIRVACAKWRDGPQVFLAVAPVVQVLTHAPLRSAQLAVGAGPPGIGAGASGSFDAASLDMAHWAEVLVGSGLGAGGPVVGAGSPGLGVGASGLFDAASQDMVHWAEVQVGSALGAGGPAMGEGSPGLGVGASGSFDAASQDMTHWAEVQVGSNLSLSRWTSTGDGRNLSPVMGDRTARLVVAGTLTTPAVVARASAPCAVGSSGLVCPSPGPAWPSLGLEQLPLSLVQSAPSSVQFAPSFPGAGKCFTSALHAEEWQV